MLSLRVSVQRTGLPRWRASQTTSASSAPKALFAPKPPPTSGATTRSSPGLQPERRHEAHEISVRHLGREPRRRAPVRADLRGRRPAPRAGRPPCAGLTIVSETTTSQPVEELLVVVHAARAAGDVRPYFGEEKNLVLRRLDHVDDDRQRVVVHRDELGGVLARRAVLAQHDRDDVADEADDVLRDHRPPHPLLEDRDRRRARGRRRRGRHR